jgi:hypothetical protein
MNIERSEVTSLRWFKSSYSSGEGGECIEIAPASSAIHVRDSKDTGQGGFAVAPTAWAAFLGLARRG